MTTTGLIQVYTGNGKGKTTASLGLAFRALGHNLKAVIIQFMKHPASYGEIKAAALLPGLSIFPIGREGFIDPKNPDIIDCKLAEDGFELAKKLILSGEYDVVILDEINVAMAFGLIKTSEVVSFLAELIKGGKNQTEIVLTGQLAPDEIIEIAHLVTEMQKIKHPFDQKVPAREGIDY